MQSPSEQMSIQSPQLSVEYLRHNSIEKTNLEYPC